MKHLSRSCPGFLLIESLIAFAVLSFAIVVCAGGIFSTFKEYAQAKKHLDLMTQAQSLIESGWHERRAIQSDNKELRVYAVPIKHGIRLPKSPSLKREYVEIIAGRNKQGNHLAGCIKE